MTKHFSRRFILSAGLSAGLGHMAFAKAPITSLRPVPRGGALSLPRTAGSAEALISSAQLGGSVSYAVADVKSGKMLETHGAKTGMPPASTAKAITALYALDTLGPNHRYATRLITNGSIAGGVLSGDLILAGGGDPTLDTDALAGMAAQLKKLGVREVRGRFLYYDKTLANLDRIDKSQPDHVGYNPTISGLNLNFNRVHFEWKRAGQSYTIQMDARSKRYRPDVKVARMKIAQRNTPVYTYRSANGRDEWSVAKAALGKGGARWLPVRKPGLYAAEVFQVFARSHGIVLKAPARANSLPKSRALVTHTSAPLQDILRDMLKYSTNLTAEVVGLSATAKRGGNAGSLKSSATHMSRWASTALGMGKVTFVDHSGLNDKSRVSAQGMVNAMLSASRRKGFSQILKPIAMRDSKRRVIKNHPIKVRAKTGTLNFVSSLAGYMTSPSGQDIAFAVICADPKRRAAIKKADMESPSGGKAWNRRAKSLQQKLIERWGTVYG